MAAARFFANHEAHALPSIDKQEAWEVERIKYKGDNDRFHEILPDFEAYFNWLQEFAGKPAPGSDAYELPRWNPEWEVYGLAVLELKDKYLKDIAEKTKRRFQEQKVIQAKL